jgi:hypothetical protein
VLLLLFIGCSSLSAWYCCLLQLSPLFYSHRLRLLDNTSARFVLLHAAGISSCIEPALQPFLSMILQCCGGLPLALKLSGGLLRKHANRLEQWQVRLHRLVQTGREQ